MESKITAELKRIAEKNAGRLFPRDVVEEARPATSPLHNSFEWDDGKAAEAWRIEQARHLIQVSVTVLPGVSSPVRAFVSLTSDRRDAGGYLTIEAVLGKVDLKEKMLKDAAAELAIFISKFKGIQELVDVTESAKKFLRSRQPSVSDAGL